MTKSGDIRAGQREAGQSVPELTEGFVLLDNSTSKSAVSTLFENPIEIVRADVPGEVPSALSAIEAGLKRGLHAAGFFAYELGYVLEPKLAHLMPVARRVPLIWMGLYFGPHELSGLEVQAWLESEAIGDPVLGGMTHTWSAQDYLQRFEDVQRNITSGDIYQLNLTFKAKFELFGSPLALYRDLRLKQRVLYGGLVDTGDVTVLSASPELFIQQNGHEIVTRPMKGTAPRAGTAAADETAREVLSSDIKQRAENLMIVDLMRNDLGRIAEIGSVQVTDLFTVETYKTLHQMTSGIRADLKDGVGLSDLLRAIFPPGSVTGAPKIRAMELIAALETEARGVYCGAIGRIAPDGHALFNVAIRTAVVGRDGKGEMGIGSGVVFDSQGQKEYAECLLKMKFLTDPVRRFELIETLLHDGPRGYWLLGQHLQRLAASATYFGFAYNEAAVQKALSHEVSGRENERLRVRLTVSEDGAVKITSTALPAPVPGAIMRYVISPSVLKSTDLFLYHKTTRRELYDSEWQHYHDTVGADEVVYLNERGEVAEGSRTTVFIRKDGQLITPPLTSGLLPGTLRAQLLAEEKAIEGLIMPDDLKTADVFLGNSVRGLQPALQIEIDETQPAAVARH